eukprot:952748-Heterocapsa_arctica.AAC.1
MSSPDPEAKDWACRSEVGWERIKVPLNFGKSVDDGLGTDFQGAAPSYLCEHASASRSVTGASEVDRAIGWQEH